MILYILIEWYLYTVASKQYGCVFSTGRECRTDINECDSNPCKHGGNCIDGTASFTCDCPPGLTGTTCEENIDECEVILFCF